MASSKHNLPSPDNSDVMSYLRTIKKQNEDILAKNEDIEDDNRKLRQELHEIKNSLKHSDVASRKRDEPEHGNELSNSNNKKARVSASVSSLPPEPELGHVTTVPEPPASFNTLDDDCLGNVLEFVGKKCYSVFGRVNKRCHEMFCSKGYPKETYLFGYGPLHLIRQQRRRGYNPGYSNGVLHYNRRDILEWMLTDESDDGYYNLKWFCYYAIKESRLDILREVFQRANEEQLEFLRDCTSGPDLCWEAAKIGKLECLKFLRENECEWDDYTWFYAKKEGHDHILEYLRNNHYPTEWQDDSDSDSESESESESE